MKHKQPLPPHLKAIKDHAITARKDTLQPKWEYKVDPASTEAQLNALGADGWELVTIGTFKRRAL